MGYTTTYIKTAQGKLLCELYNDEEYVEQKTYTASKSDVKHKFNVIKITSKNICGVKFRTLVVKEM